MYADKGTDTEKQYYVTDPHGNVVQLTDEGGKVTKTYEYDSFGNEVKPDSKDDNPFRYCGEYYDKETGEVYLRARYYQPAVGRFLTRDSYTGQEDEPESLHLYTYCGNDGVNAWDPSGNCYNVDWELQEKNPDLLMPVKWEYKCENFEKENPRRVSANGLKFIKEAEGFFPKPYVGQDVKNTTIGYGHVIKKGEKFTSLTKREASALLKDDVIGEKKKNGKRGKSAYRKQLNKLLNKKVKIHVRQNQYDALTSLVFNVGPYMWDKSPKFKNLLKSGDLDTETQKKKVVEQFVSYIHYTGSDGRKHKSRGLWRRHVNEGILFVENDYNYKDFEQLKNIGWEFQSS